MYTATTYDHSNCFLPRDNSRAVLHHDKVMSFGTAASCVLRKTCFFKVTPDLRCLFGKQPWVLCSMTISNCTIGTPLAVRPVDIKPLSDCCCVCTPFRISYRSTWVAQTYTSCRLQLRMGFPWMVEQIVLTDRIRKVCTQTLPYILNQQSR
jgi:hypothetical protein